MAKKMKQHEFTYTELQRLHQIQQLQTMGWDIDVEYEVPNKASRLNPTSCETWFKSPRLRSLYYKRSKKLLSGKRLQLYELQAWREEQKIAQGKYRWVK